MEKYEVMLENLNLPFQYELKENTDDTGDDKYKWHFSFSHYHFGFENETDPESPEIYGYGRMQLDLDIFDKTKEACAKKAYLTLKSFTKAMNDGFKSPVG